MALTLSGNAMDPSSQGSAGSGTVAIVPSEGPPSCPLPLEPADSASADRFPSLTSPTRLSQRPSCPRYTKAYGIGNEMRTPARPTSCLEGFDSAMAHDQGVYADKRCPDFRHGNPATGPASWAGVFGRRRIPAYTARTESRGPSHRIPVGKRHGRPDDPEGSRGCPDPAGASVPL